MGLISTSVVPNKQGKKLIALVILIGIMNLISGCGLHGKSAETNTHETMSVPSGSSTDDESGSEAPNEPVVVICTPGESDHSAINKFKNEIVDLLEQSALDYEIVPSIEEARLNDASLVFAFENDPGISDLAARYLGVQFVAIGIPGVSTSENVSVLGSDGLEMDKLSFAAGYIAATIADDWRAGGIILGTGAESESMETGFLNGARYFCGLCRTAFPPFYEYPQSFRVDINGQSWASVVEYINERQFDVIFITPTDIFATGVNQWVEMESVIIGDGPRPVIVPEDRWVATVQYSAVDGLQSIWNELLEGNGGFELAWKLQIVDVNHDLLSMGREREALELIDELETGFVDTGYDL
jgi:hypothetical protein